MKRYAAKLLFQFHVAVTGDSGKRRICEERIINFQARSSREALRSTKLRGRRSEYAYTNTDGQKVSFEFIGVLDLMSLGVERDAETVWYDVRTRSLPKKRQAGTVPSDSELLARLSR